MPTPNDHNTMPSATDLINMISGIYTSPLWEELKFYSTSLDTLRKIQKSIAALQECGKSMEAFGLVVALHDLTELDVPEAITGLEAFPDGIKMFMDEFITDTHDLIWEFIVGVRSTSSPYSLSDSKVIDSVCSGGANRCGIAVSR